ncbi:hypothetical protein KH5_16890 [Urechidicola sp. KH5]
MTFLKGAKVLVIDEAIRGVVLSTNGNYVTIETEDGFEMQFTKNELVLVNQEQAELAKNSRVLFSLNEKESSAIKRSTVRRNRKEPVPPMEVDLHIEKLTKNTRGLDNYDMLSLQIDTAKRQLEFAIRKRIPRIVFIHGVGEGVLKSELHYLLNRYPVQIQQASYQKYGMGATEVYILQNV